MPTFIVVLQCVIKKKLVDAMLRPEKKEKKLSTF